MGMICLYFVCSPLLAIPLGVTFCRTVCSVGVRAAVDARVVTLYPPAELWGYLWNNKIKTERIKLKRLRFAAI